MCQMVAEHQEKSICGLLFLGKQTYQPASKASDFRSRIFINLASSSQFIQYFIFILCHNDSFFKLLYHLLLHPFSSSFSKTIFNR